MQKLARFSDNTVVFLQKCFFMICKLKIVLANLVTVAKKVNKTHLST